MTWGIHAIGFLELGDVVSGREGGREGGRKRQGDILLVKDITKRTEKKGKLKEKVRKKKRERDYQKERKRRIK